MLLEVDRLLLVGHDLSLGDVLVFELPLDWKSLKLSVNIIILVQRLTEIAYLGFCWTDFSRTLSTSFGRLFGLLSNYINVFLWITPGRG